jgi:hypothetical protein
MFADVMREKYPGLDPASAAGYAVQMQTQMRGWFSDEFFAAANTQSLMIACARSSNIVRQIIVDPVAADVAGLVDLRQ